MPPLNALKGEAKKNKFVSLTFCIPKQTATANIICQWRRRPRKMFTVARLAIHAAGISALALIVLAITTHL
jgi:hypothetical protein